MHGIARKKNFKATTDFANLHGFFTAKDAKIAKKTKQIFHQKIMKKMKEGLKKKTTPQRSQRTQRKTKKLRITRIIF